MGWMELWRITGISAGGSPLKIRRAMRAASSACLRPLSIRPPSTPLPRVYSQGEYTGRPEWLNTREVLSGTVSLTPSGVR